MNINPKTHSHPPSSPLPSPPPLSPPSLLPPPPGKDGTTPLGDLATIVCSYDETKGYTSNSLSSYFNDIGGRQKLDNELHVWLGASEEQSLGGIMGSLLLLILGLSLGVILGVVVGGRSVRLLLIILLVCCCCCCWWWWWWWWSSKQKQKTKKFIQH